MMSTAATEPIRQIHRLLSAMAPDDLNRLDLLKIRKIFLEGLESADHIITNFLENRNVTTTAIESMDDVDAALQQSDEQSEAIYREYVYALAEGGPINLTDLRTIAADSRRTPADVQRHYALLVGRRDACIAIERSKALADSLPQLKTASDIAAEAVREKQERHAADLRPLLVAQRAAHEAYEQTRHESASLSREAIATLNRSRSPEYDAEFARLSNAASQAAEKLSQAREAGRRKDGVRQDLEREATWHEREIARLSNSPNPGDALENRRKALAGVHADIADLDRIVDRIQTAWREHEAAKAALAEFEKAEFFNWRNMVFA